jgi:uncharacterized membrane protein
MAGIGFRLHRVVANGGYLQAASAYLSSAVISAGPWLTSTLSLAVLSSASGLFLNDKDRTLLFTTISYAFFGSLVLSYGVQMVVTRYLADCLYLKQVDTFVPTCVGVLCCAAPMFVIASPFLILAPFEWRYRLMAVTLLLTLSLLWLILVFLSAMRDYMRIVVIFVVGYALSLAAALGLGLAYGVFGSLAGFTAGQVICLALLIGHVYTEFPVTLHISLAYLSYFRRYWDIFLVGLLYGAGLWADNVIYWFSPDGVVVRGFFHVFPPYDTVKLVGYLLTIPAASLFLVHAETRIYTHFSAFLRGGEMRRPLREISQAKQELASAMWAGIVSIAKLQGVVALTAIVFAPDIAVWFGLPASWVVYLRVVAVAASVQYLMLVGLLLLLYLDHRKAALAGLATFVSIDIIASEALVRLGQRDYGIGYLLAAITGALLIFWCLRQRLRRLEYATFMLGPLA